MNAISAKLAIVGSDEQVVEPSSSSTTELSHQDFLSLLSNCQEPICLEDFKNNYIDSGPGRRQTPRYGLRVEVLICSAHRAFRTKTTNVSMSGLLLKDYIPDELMRGAVDIVLIDESRPEGKKYLVFRGKAVGGPLRSQRLFFNSAAPLAQNELAKLVEDLTPILTYR